MTGRRVFLKALLVAGLLVAMAWTQVVGDDPVGGVGGVGVPGGGGGGGGPSGTGGGGGNGRPGGPSGAGGGGGYGGGGYPSGKPGSYGCSDKEVALAINFGFTGNIQTTHLEFQAVICAIVRGGFVDPFQLTYCKAKRSNNYRGQLYNMMSVHIKVWLKNSYQLSGKLPSFFNSQTFTTKAQIYKIQIQPQSIEFRDVDECNLDTNICSPNAFCYNTWGSYKCTCKDSFRDKSKAHQCPGTICYKPKLSGINMSTWMYVLIGVAVVVLLMLLFCCCCFYSGSGIMKKKSVKHIQIVQAPEPVQQLSLPPPCICKPPEEKKIIIQVENVPAPAPAPVHVPLPALLPGNSAFISDMDSGYGNVYTSAGATRALPWSGGSNLVSTMTTAEPQIAYVQEPQMVMVPEEQYMQQEQPMYVQQEQPMYVQQEQPVYVLQ